MSEAAPPEVRQLEPADLYRDSGLGFGGIKPINPDDLKGPVSTRNPDGSVTVTYPNGKTVTTYPDGRVITTYPPPMERTVTQYPPPDGREITQYPPIPGGPVSVRFPNGDSVIIRPDNVEQWMEDGREYWVLPDGTITDEEPSDIPSDLG
jgi:hypothetical protein